MKLDRAVLRLIVFALPLAVLLGPRVGFSGLPLGDFRTQDLVVAGAVFYFLFFDLKRVLASAVEGGHTSHGLVLVFWAILLIPVAFISLDVADSSGVFQFFYLVRLVEPLVIGLLMYRALDSIGEKGIWVFVTSTGAAVFLNLVWIGAQLFRQEYGAFWSFGREPNAVHYGPGLVGDFAAFPTGQTLVVVLAGFIGFHFFSTMLAMNLRRVLAGAIILTFGAVILVESRISTIFAIILLTLWAFKMLRSAYRSSVPLASSFVLAAALILGTFGPQLRRFEITNLLRGLDDRIVEIHPTVLARLNNEFFFGAGPGVIRSETGWEYHSLYLGFLSSFGFLGLFLILIAMGLIVWLAQRYGLKGTNSLLRVFSFWTIAILSNLLFAGVLQDSYIAVAPNHLGAMVVGVFFWLLRRELRGNQQAAASVKIKIRPRHF